MNFIGTWMLRFAFACCLTAFLLIVFKKESDESKNLGILTGVVSCFGVLISSILLFYSLISGIFSVEYVYHSTEKSLPLIYKISAFWSGSSGSMLFWTSAFAVLLIIIYFRDRHKNSTKTIFGVLLFVMTLFMFVVTFINNPFKLVSAESDGFGLNPALQSLGMVFHPPVIIISFSFFFIAFAYQLFDIRKNTEEHVEITWKWAMWGWILLTFGIVTGGIWAYTELGWGGYWAWDPIENSSLVNWLFATAFIHGLRIKGKNNKRMNFVLIFLTVFTILVGTYIARSGLLESVHAYSSRGVTVVFGVVLLVLILFFIIYNFKIKKLHANDISDNHNENSFKKILLALIKPSNMFSTLTIITAVLVFGGTTFPLYGGLFVSDASATPISFYEYVFGIYGILILLIMAINPMFSPKKFLLIPGSACGLIILGLMLFLTEYSILTNLCLSVCAMLTVNLIIQLVIKYKNRTVHLSHTANILLHASLIIMAVGVACSMGMLVSTNETLEKGNVMVVKEYEVKYRNLYWKEEPGKTTAVSVVGVSGPMGKIQLKPELSYYQKMKTAHSRAVIKSTFKEDLYIIFEGIDENDNISLKVKIVKWISLIWIGSVLLILGTVLYYFSETKKTKDKLIKKLE
ncbi:cytochrome c biogenesis protein CcsA [Ruminiclostridium herbifermentans]|uniref:Cytochrome c biogenesis protein CcsA n=1 Tax=Ruminiclostridium herbifermentans TaxID=2488810 RepID=A0A4V6EP01_9FIRM|nr:cytochrome c biogenesis protein CcsA [Ruminiclostridium herbifermentans]QNU68901.1 cytochrome c biogenesis protein CcsA [Ruminiclostridium herbifermentans]